MKLAQAGWAVCVQTEDGPSPALDARSIGSTRSYHGYELPLIFGPHMKDLAESECRKRNDELPEPYWTVEPVTVTAGSP